MADSLTISIGADASKLRANLAVAQSELRAFSRELNGAANSARKVGDDLSLAKVGQAAASFEAASSRVAELKTQMEGAARTGQVLAGSWKLNTGGLMEMKAAGVNAFQAWASGMDVTRVAMTEGAQVLGGLVQSGVKLTSTWAIVGAGAVAAAAGIGFLALRAYEAHQNLLSLNAELALTGRGNISPTDLDTAAKALADKWNLSKSEALAAITEIAKSSRALNFQQLQQVADLAAAEARLRNVSLSDAAKEFKIGDAKAAIALANSYNLVTTAEERMLAAGNESGALISALQKIKENIDQHGGAWALAKARFEQYTQAVAAIGGAGFFPAASDIAGGQTGLGPAPAFPGNEPPAGGRASWMAQWLADRGVSANAQRAIGGNAAIESGFRPDAVGPLGHRGLFQWDQSRWAAGGSPEGDAGRQMELMLKELEQRLPGFTKSTAPVAELTRMFNKVFEVAGSPDAPRIAAAERFQPATGANAPAEAKAKLDADTKAEAIAQQQRAVEHRHSLEQQFEDAKIHAAKMAELHGTESDQFKQAKEEARQKAAQVDDSETGLYIANLKAKQAAAVDFAEKIRIQDEITAYRRQRGERPLDGGGVDKAAVAQDAIERAALVRQQGQQGFQLSEQGAAAMRQARGDMLRGYEAEREQLVKLGALDPFTALGQSLVKAKDLANENAVALQNLMQSATALTERAKVYWEQWREGIRAKSEEQELRKRIAAESKAVNDRWAAPIRSALDSVGSSFESAASGLLTGKKTFGQALGDLRETGTSAVVSMGGSLLSKLAGRAAGDQTGKGIGEVISDKLMSALFGEAAQSAQISLLTTIAVNTGITAGNTAASAATGAASAGTSALSAAGSAASIGSAASGGGGFFSWVGSLFETIGPAAAVVALSRGGIIPSAARGMIAPGRYSLPAKFGTDSVLSALTPGEMVLPQRLSEGMQNFIAGGGGAPAGGDNHLHFHGPADGPSVQRWFTNMMAKNPGAISRMFNQNAFPIR